jgi:serine/threonine protein kinase/tetratricopeptide (TPR) repeat protein
MTFGGVETSIRMKERKQKLEAIFEEALALSIPEERARRLDEACGNDLDLRREVEELLRAADQAGGFLAMKQGETAALSDNPLPPSETESASVERSGDYIGRYKLLQKIGEGGCGVVYMAEQEEPVRRRVALKIIKLGMDTRQVVARFEVERQALAMMDHPNIAKIFDAGSTERPLPQPANPQLTAGRPYFVMELVRGVRITEYCDENNLSTTQRLDLFVQVCQAVQHAHQKGIIHRDLKPSNVLVTINDGAPVPKVIDFGVAKATEQRLTDKTLFTEFHQFIGTPAYMSPEQALMTSLDIDTRSDIYSLGVLLYELLTGRTPLNTPQLLKAGLDEMRRTIREAEPARPSNRLSTLPREDLTTAAKRRSTNPPQLIHAIRGDLDWIVMKCLEKDRTRRYDTANGLAADVQRHLKNEPIVARPPSRIYQFQKMVQRNRVAFAAAAIVLLALLSGLTFATWAFVRERAARRHAAIETAKARQVASFLKEMIQGIEPSVAMGRDITLLRDIADQTTARLGKEQNLPPEVDVELRATLGAVYHQIVDYKKAEAMHRETLPRMRAVLGNEHPNLADLLRDYTCVLRDRGKYEQSEAMARESLAISRKLHGPEHADVAASLRQLASTLDMRKQFAESEAMHRQSLAIYRKVYGPEHHDIAVGLRWLANSFVEQGLLEEAESTYRDALTMMKKVDGDVHPEIAATLSFFTDVLQSRQKFAEQESALRELLALYRKVIGYERHRVAKTLNDLGAVIHNQGRYDEAEPYLREALALHRRLGEEGPELARTLNNLATTLEAQRRYSEAEPLLREALAIQRRLVPSKQKDLEGSVRELGYVLSQLKQFAEAEKLGRELWQMVEGRVGPDHPETARALTGLGRILSDWVWAERFNKTDVNGAGGRTCAEMAREAERILREALAIRLKRTNATALTTIEWKSRIAGALITVAATDTELTANIRDAKLTEAETLLIEAERALRESRTERRYYRHTLERLVRLYEAWNKPVHATEWRAKFENLDRKQAEKESLTNNEASLETLTPP